MINILVFIAVYIMKPILFILCILSTYIGALFVAQELRKQYFPANSKPAKQKPIKPSKEVYYA